MFLRRVCFAVAILNFRERQAPDLRGEGEFSWEGRQATIPWSGPGRASPQGARRHRPGGGAGRGRRHPGENAAPGRHRR